MVAFYCIEKHVNEIVEFDNSISNLRKDKNKKSQENVIKIGFIYFHWHTLAHEINDTIISDLRAYYYSAKNVAM